MSATFRVAGILNLFFSFVEILARISSVVPGLGRKADGYGPEA